MLTRLSECLRRHEPLTKFLLRIVLLAILAVSAWDFHFMTLDVSDIADRIEQMQDDLSNLRNDIENGNDSGDAPAQLKRSSI